MVKQLATWDNFSSRATASHLLSICYQKINDDTIRNEVINVF